MNFSYIYHVYNVRKIMFLVIIACIPAIITKCYFFGSGALIQILFSTVVAFLLEMIFLKICCKNINENLYDNSAILTSVLFAISIPSLLPWWMTIIGIFFSIIISKNLYGGVGQNTFNPAMVGYAVLLISFPLEMNHWNERNSSLSFLNDVKYSFNSIFSKKMTYYTDNIKLNSHPDVFTEATPLDKFKTKYRLQNNYSSEKSIFLNKKITVQDSWKYINISFILGGIFLLYQGIICWRIPLSFLITLSFFSSVTYLYSTELFVSPFFHFFSGGTMICAFFIATDPVTTACANIGKIIFGIIIGFLVWIIRNYSDYPDAIAFSVLFGNMIVPLIDYYIKGSGYGHA